MLSSRHKLLFIKYGGREVHSESGWCTPGPGLYTQQNRTPDPGIYGSGLCDQQYRSPDELKIPDSGLRIAQYRTPG